MNRPRESLALARSDRRRLLQYVDLDEFLSENGMPGEALGGAHLGGSAFGAAGGLALGLQAPVTKRERSPSPSDCMSPDTINPPLSPADSSMYSGERLLYLHLPAIERLPVFLTNFSTFYWSINITFRDSKFKKNHESFP